MGMMTTQSAYPEPVTGAPSNVIVDPGSITATQTRPPAIPAVRPKPAVPMTASEAVSTILLLRDRFVANSQPYDLADSVLTFLQGIAAAIRKGNRSKG